MFSANNDNIIKNIKMISTKFTTNKYLIIILIIFILLTSPTEGDSDWIQDCGICHCHWESGKKTADCKNRSITTIPKEFNSELQVLDLSYNQIPELKREQFIDSNLPNLHKLYMKNCTIQELNRDSLKGLAILFLLDLSNNYIKLLPSGIFTDLVKLRNLIMNNNEIEILDNHLFYNLTFLSRVEFKNNHIKLIEINTFYNLPSLSLIYLESNRLSILKRETFDKIPKLKHLNLAQNPWNCTCKLKEFRDFTINQNLYTAPTDCYEPHYLRGKLWSDIQTDYFACQPKILQPRHTGAYVEASSENITLICRIDANPIPDIIWMFNKRPIKTNERIHIAKPFIDNNQNDLQHNNHQHSHSSSSSSNITISELFIYGLRTSDRGIYTCLAENRAGKDEGDIQLSVNFEHFLEAGIAGTDSSSNLLLIICCIAITLLLLLIVVVLVLCWYCRRIRNYTKDTSMSENGLITSKIMDKTQNGSVLEGSVIMEMQKSLLTEVNPVEKPPRRTELDSIDTDDGHEIKKTLLDETPFGSHDDDTNSITLSDTTPRSRATYVDDGYGTTLPPDLLSFPANQRVPQSPSLQSSMSNIPDNRTLYCKSPLSSPVYQHVIQNGHNNIYGPAQSGFRTLQHPKNRNLALAAVSRNQQQQSPFLPAPVVYPPVIMKQGYMTIPRKPRVPSWTPSISTTLSEFQTSATSPITTNSINGTESIIDDNESIIINEPVYDNLGLRTTAGGNSVLNLNKIGINSTNKQQQSNSIKYTMKDRPLPATPINHHSLNNGFSNNTNINNSSGNNYHHQNGIINNSNNSTKIYEPIHELNNLSTTTCSDTEPLYGQARNHSGMTIVPSLQNTTNNLGQTLNNNNNNNINKMVKIPPRPPPKPKKKMSVTSTGQGGSTSQLCFEDEGEDGTEV